jgi:hypothetical protein
MMRYRRTKPDGTSATVEVSNSASAVRGWSQQPSSASGAIRTSASAGLAGNMGLGGVPALMTKDGVRTQSASQQPQPPGAMFKSNTATQPAAAPALSSAKKVFSWTLWFV